MTNLNVTVLEGCVAKDAELKKTQNGKSYCVITLVVNRDYKTGEEWTERASFFNISVWGKRAESLFKYLKKGTKIAVEGYLEQTRWDDNGDKKSRVDIRVKMLHLLSKSEKQVAEQKSAQTEQMPAAGVAEENLGPAQETTFSFSDDNIDDYGEIF